jgi:hypothetical protein
MNDRKRTPAKRAAQRDRAKGSDVDWARDANTGAPVSASEAEMREIAARRPGLVADAKEILGRRGRAARPEAKWTGDKLSYSDGPEIENALATLVASDVLGHRGGEAFGVHLGQIDYVTRQRGEARGVSSANLNAGLAIVASAAPENELEAALAVQMAGCHALAVEMLGRARSTSNTEHMALYGGLAVKLTRTFAAQMEALAKIRTKGKQVVEVVHIHKHVHVGPGGRAIVADVFNAGGPGGGAAESGGQSHVLAGAYTLGAPLPPMRSQDADGEPMRRAGDQRQGSMQDARRPERSSERATQRQLEGRGLDAGGDTVAPRRRRSDPRLPAGPREP